MASRAEELYDLYLDACLGGAAEPPDAFCARHPEGGEELRRRIEALYRLVDDGKAASPEPRAADRGLPFERLGEFRLLRPLEQGGMGSVYLAEQEALGRLVALKVVRPELMDSPTAAERFRREALAVARLNHPGIVGVHALGEDQGLRYIAMELVPGRSLGEVLGEHAGQGRKVPARTAASWLAQVARAAHHAHEQGIIHRDIKPANIRITPDGRPRLLDFGVARDERWRGKTVTEAFTGSPLYASPEQLFGRPVDARADVYGLGATLYQCLTGRTPFDAETLERLTARILVEEPVPPRRLSPAVPRDLEVIALKCLERDPGRRYATAAALADDLEAHLDSRPILARPPGPLPRLLKWARRRPWPAAALLLVTLLGAGLVGWLVWQRAARSAEARRTFAQARARIETYRERRRAMERHEAGVAKVQREISSQYRTEAEDLLIEEAEDAVAAARREREAAFYEVLDLVRRAEALDPEAGDADLIRAELYVEKWIEARTVRDQEAAASYKDLVARLDPGGVFAAAMRAPRRFRFTAEPADAGIYLFRYAEQGHRLVPEPYLGLPDGVRAGEVVHRVVNRAGGFEPGDLVLERGEVARVFRGGRVEGAALPPGLELRPTATPLYLCPSAFAGPAPFEADLDEGVYLAVVRAPGFEEQRWSFETVTVIVTAPHFRLRPHGSTPPGFVRVPTESCDATFLIMEREVTAAEYLEFLNDPEVRPRIGPDSLFPRQPDNRAAGGLWERDASGLYRVPADWDARWPIVGLSFDDATEYARWRTEQARRAGMRHSFALPTFMEWKLATAVGAARIYPFGNRWRPKWVKSCYARPNANLEPVLSYPIDESPYGIFDLCGSAMEWLDDWYDEPRGYRRLGGGSWARAQPSEFFAYGAGAIPSSTGGEYGLRLVLREEGS